MANRPNSYSRLYVGPRVGAGPELSLKRKTLGKLVSARIQYGDFLSYKERFNLDHNVINCSYGIEKAPDHFYKYPIAWEK